MKNIELDVMAMIFLILAAIMVYGKYFVETTEIDKAFSGVMAMFFILLSMSIAILKKLEEKNKK